MSVDTSWDIESYRTAYESDEHWALKRDFMEAHKDRIPEARLICLAQVFVNVELLGCKYPDAVMKEVAVLARDVGHDYRESKKRKLQRTFVKASDAAGAKVKGTSTSSLLGGFPCNKSSLRTEQGMSVSPMSSGPTAPMSSLLPGPPAPMSSVDIGRPTSTSSLLGQPPATLSSRLAALSNPVSFVKAGTSNPLSMLGGSSNAMSMRGGSSSSNSMSSMYGGSSNMTSMPGGSSSSNSMSSMYGGSSNMTSMASGSSSNSMSSMYGGSSNAMSMPGGSSSSNSMSSMYGGSANMTAMPGGSSSSSSMSSMYGGSSNAMSMPGGSSSSNSMSSVYGGSANMTSMPAGSSSNSTSTYGGSSDTTSIPGGSSTSSNPMSSMFGGSSNTTSLLGNPPSPNSVSLILGGASNAMPMLGGSSSSNSTAAIFGGSSNSLLSMPSGSAAPKTTLITAPPAPKKKKSKADKEKPITEKFVRFVGGKSDTGATPDSLDKTANTVPLHKFGGKIGETSGQTSRFGQPAQPSQSQPSTAAATPQHNHLSNWCKVVGRDNPLAGFVLVRHESHDNNGAAAAILNTSSCFSRIPINYHYQKVDHLFECTVNINGVDVVTAKAIGRKKAREQAVVEAVAVLPKHCFTLKIKKSIRAESVTLDQVANDLAARRSFSDNPLATDSVANKMMKQMGWTGGGLGKKGEGITEPIRPSEVFGRQGLGHIETNKGAVTPAFRKRVRDIISEYASNAKNVALAFSSEFSKEQRAEIHKIARLCHLKSASRGKDGKNRCLVISRKVPAQDLLLRLLQEGSNDQYQLLPPSSTS